MANNFIELNGNRYDATTGAFLGKASQQLADATPAMRNSQPIAKLQASTYVGTLDGVIRHPAHTQRTHHHTAAHQPQHARTLRRDGVRQPIFERKPSIKTQSPTDLVPFQPSVLVAKPKLSSEVVDIARAHRAQTTQQSPKIERFRPTLLAQSQQFTQDGVPVKLAHIPVKQAPTGRSMDMIGPAQNTAQPTQLLTQPVAKRHDIFEQALAHATSHEQLAPKEIAHKTKHARRRHKRGIQLAASALVLVLLGTFIFWQNRASMEIQLAAARSGVAASMPSYRPSGFAFKHLTYSPGAVTLGFTSNDNKSYSVVQKSSNWDSETLLQNYVATNGQTYKTYSAAGRTVYVYGNGDATWVNGGIWYQVNDSGTLSKDQVLNLATSM